MPYLRDAQRREEIEEALDLFAVQATEIRSGAELNFVLCRLIDRFLETEGLGYDHIEELKGAVYGAVQEFHDRIVRPYEDLKRAQNGEVFYWAAAELDRITPRR